MIYNKPKLFKDRWGETWELLNDGYKFYVVRVRDGNIGGWFNGEGLKPYE